MTQTTPTRNDGRAAGWGFPFLSATCLSRSWFCFGVSGQGEFLDGPSPSPPDRSLLPTTKSVIDRLGVARGRQWQVD